ncbi:MAG: 2-oxo acid dehydrogenase subunit E2, partial [Cyclobacteriaceae bacterium]
MAEIVQMPKMSDTMEEGVIAAWHKKVGDTVEEGELMAEVETDKATMEYESYHEGTVLYLGGAEGDAIAVNGVLAIVGEKGEDYKALLSGVDAAGGSTEEKATESATPVASSSEAIDISGINAEIVPMPKMSDTMEEGIIAAWHKKVGDTVEEGELMAEVETDKATMEYESYHDGTVLYLGAKEGEGVIVNGVLAIVGDKDADWKTLLKSAEQGNSAPAAAPAEEKAAPAPVAAKAEAPKVASKPAATSSSSDGRVKASPLAKKIAADKGIQLTQVAGSGPNGRVTKADIDSFTPSANASSGAAVPMAIGEESFEDIKMNGMRKAIAKNLSSSQFGAPHFYLTMDIDMDNAIAARKSMNEVAPAKISFNDMVVKAVATSLKQHPLVNSMVLDDVVRVNNHVNVGVAVAIPDGLVVPVIPHTDLLSLSQ